MEVRYAYLREWRRFFGHHGQLSLKKQIIILIFCKTYYYLYLCIRKRKKGGGAIKLLFLFLYTECMIDKNAVTLLVNEWLEGKDYFLVDVTVSPDDKIVVEIDHAEGVWIDDCVDLSRYIESKLNRDEEDYELEVGSAGIGQPFKVLQPYINYIGKDVEVLTKDGKKYVGTLAGADADHFTVTVTVKVKPEGAKRPKLEEQELTFAYDEIKYTKYLISFR